MSNLPIGATGSETTPQQQAGAGFAFGAINPTSTTPKVDGFSAAAAAPSFGATSTPAFGTTGAAPAFGATSTPAFSARAPAPAFGATSTPGFAAVGASPAFGAPGAAPSFGATSTPNFGAAAAAPAFGAPAFGSTSATPAPAFSAASSNFSAPTGLAVAGSTGFGFAGTSQATNASNAAPPMAFGASTITSQAATGTVPTIGGLGGVTNFSFGKPAPNTSASLNFTTNTTATLGGGLFGKPATTTNAAAPVPYPLYGLGGTDASSNKPKTGDSQQDIHVKETQVPMEIARTVDGIKDCIKTQKLLSSDIGRTSISKLTNVTSEMMNMQWSLQKIATSLQDNYNQIKGLRQDSSSTIQFVEMAQRTQDTPMGLQFENIAPYQFFQNLVAKYEQDIIKFREQIALTERHMYNLTNSQHLTPEDLKRGFHQISESFISLAGRLQENHQAVELQKEQFLSLRKGHFRENSNIFDELNNLEENMDISRVSAGPTPFSNIMALCNFGKPFGKTANQTGNPQ